MQLGDTYAVSIHKLWTQILPRSIDKQQPVEDELQEDEPVILEPPATKARDSEIGSYDVVLMSAIDPWNQMFWCWDRRTLMFRNSVRPRKKGPTLMSLQTWWSQRCWRTDSTTQPGTQRVRGKFRGAKEKQEHHAHCRDTRSLLDMKYGVSWKQKRFSVWFIRWWWCLCRIFSILKLKHGHRLSGQGIPPAFCGRVQSLDYGEQAWEFLKPLREMTWVELHLH